MFSVEERDGVRDRVLEMATSDARVIAGAVVGSLARNEGDRWSDLDLTFAVADGLPVVDVLEDWTRSLVDEFDAVHLFDLSFTPASEFAAGGPKFRLLFGSVVEKPYPPPPSASELFGYAVHHALRARFCIERGRYWQAEYWVSGVRDYALSLACRQRDLPARRGIGFDDLPAELRDAFTDALVFSLERDELLRALASAVAGLLREATEVADIAAKVESQLRELTSTAPL